MNSHPMLLTGSANESLALSIARAIDVPLVPRELVAFPDGEVRATILGSVRGGDVFLIQPTGPPVERNLFELLLLADACRRAGSSRITAVIPYFGYARQDRRTGRQSVGARLIADIIRTSGVDRIVAVDLHNAALESAFGMPLEHFSACPILADAMKSVAPSHAVVVAPDLGAAKLADRYAVRLGLPVAIVHKTRISGESVQVHRITGDVVNRVPIVVDDMISTGGTIVAAMNALVDAGCRPAAIVVTSHALLVGTAVDELRELSLSAFITTDTLGPAISTGLPIQVVSVAPMLAEAIVRLHENRSLCELIAT